jgi:phosphoglycolate phosphatase-like HAD superfamily hydrolase
LKKSTFITDFDNTLYDWFTMWHASFSAMLAEVSRISGVSEEKLKLEIRPIHQKYRTSEYSHLLEEVPSLQAMSASANVQTVFGSAIHAYRKARKATLVLYEDVESTLRSLKQKNIRVIVYTESLAYYSHYRITSLGLDGLVDEIYSPVDHDLPAGNRVGFSTQAPPLKQTIHQYTPTGVIKPNPELLLNIVNDAGRNPDQCVYLGDSLMKDVAMAQLAGVTDVLAAYGEIADKEKYKILQEVSHWSQADVDREKSITKSHVIPSHVIRSFREIEAFF